MSRGPIPKSAELRKREGNPGKVAIRDEVKPPPLRPERPPWLVGYAKEEWEFIVPHLERLGLLTQIDGTALGLYCLSYGRWREAEEILNSEGLTYTTPRGSKYKHPACSISKQYYDQMRQMLGEFGLTPQARARLSVVEEEGDEATDFFGY